MPDCWSNWFVYLASLSILEKGGLAQHQVSQLAADPLNRPSTSCHNASHICRSASGRLASAAGSRTPARAGNLPGHLRGVCGTRLRSGRQARLRQLDQLRVGATAVESRERLGGVPLTCPGSIGELVGFAGWNRRHPILGSIVAYDVAYWRLYDAVAGLLPRHARDTAQAPEKQGSEPVGETGRTEAAGKASSRV